MPTRVHLLRDELTGPHMLLLGCLFFDRAVHQKVREREGLVNFLLTRDSTS
ncbi:Protein CBG27556 [Caenorhabditis briggsae]|uniref:Protein CBG27556 n=1 Tax=Caenorhabditis briggsae TaxID=6238 RepID=B6IKM0_CAEBR|nr:Protein CBG27556 [Caenorhabditis briggsae]CAS00450.1 Protein CBG27556 [Caenorhabditis briggsae]